MLVVVPWSLDRVVSGQPITFKPFVVTARYAAEYRNHWWVNVRRTKSDSTIESPSDVSPYPLSKDRIADKPVSDGGGNFGRIARTGLLDEYVDATMQTALCGIPTHDWVTFLKRFRQ